MTLALLLTVAATVQTPDTASAFSGESPSFFWILLQTIFALAVVVAGIVGFVWLLKQLMNRTASPNQDNKSNSQFHLVRQLPLSPKNSIYMIRILDDLFVVSNTEEDLKLLHRYEDFNKWESIETQQAQVAAGFSQFFQGALSRNKN
jgi:flagellar biogenesis protein FliO